MFIEINFYFEASKRGEDLFLDIFGDLCYLSTVSSKLLIIALIWNYSFLP